MSGTNANNSKRSRSSEESKSTRSTTEKIALWSPDSRCPSSIESPWLGMPTSVWHYVFDILLTGNVNKMALPTLARFARTCRHFHEVVCSYPFWTNMAAFCAISKVWPDACHEVAKGMFFECRSGDRLRFHRLGHKWSHWCLLADKCLLHSNKTKPVFCRECCPKCKPSDPLMYDTICQKCQLGFL